jgi:hypothetical protein
MKTLIAAALSCLIAVPAFAKTFELPEANPAISVNFPNSWKPSETENGVEATSPDGETYIAVETATAKGMDKLIDEDIKFLNDQGVTVDKSTQQTHDATQNGMSVSYLRWSGKDKDGPTNVTLGIFGVSSNLIVLMTAWSSPNGETANDKDMSQIVGSIKKR